MPGEVSGPFDLHPGFLRLDDVSRLPLISRQSPRKHRVSSGIPCDTCAARPLIASAFGPIGDPRDHHRTSHKACSRAHYIRMQYGTYPGQLSSYMCFMIPLLHRDDPDTWLLWKKVHPGNRTCLYNSQPWIQAFEGSSKAQRG